MISKLTCVFSVYCGKAAGITAAVGHVCGNTAVTGRVNAVIAWDWEEWAETKSTMMLVKC